MKARSIVLAALGITCACTILTTEPKGITLKTLTAEASKICYCAPAPGHICVNEYNGIITIDYKVVCRDASEDPNPLEHL
jgi:hypothetical protein